MVNTKELIENTFRSVAVLTIIVFVLVFIVYGCLGVHEQLKEALTVTVGCFGGFATLGAAFIAANLFNNWQDVQDGSNRSEHAKSTLRNLIHLQSTLDYYLEEVWTIATHYTPSDLEKCILLRNTINKKYLDLQTEYGVSAAYYKAVYKDNLPIPQTNQENNFNSYLFSINGALSRLTKRNPESNEVSVEYYLEQAETQKQNFKEKIVDEVAKKLAPHIVMN